MTQTKNIEALMMQYDGQTFIAVSSIMEMLNTCKQWGTYALIDDIMRTITSLDNNYKTTLKNRGVNSVSYKTTRANRFTHTSR